MTAARPPLLELRELSVRYRRDEDWRRSDAGVLAVDRVSLQIGPGEWLGLVGESGCGKSSLGKAIVRLVTPSAGQVLFEGIDISHASGEKMRPLRRRMQMIFQDPYSSLDPRMSVGRTLEEPLAIHDLAPGRRRERVAELLRLVGLPEDAAERYPHEFSGGQRQRIGVARALAVEPAFIVCDEPISALDVSIQAQILNLLADLREQFGLTYLFIAHNLPAVAMFSDRVAVMYLGQLMEIGSPADLRERTAHPYTKALLSAVPVADPAVERKRMRVMLPGELPSVTEPMAGCRFCSRCWLYRKLGEPARCREEEPPMAGEAGHMARCHYSAAVTDS